MRKPAPGLVVHVGEVTNGQPKVGDEAIAEVDAQRRRDIMRNHTATHLLHSELRRVLGEHARQAGSLVAPDRLRFDFNHPEAVTKEQLSEIEAGVNQHILGDYSLKITVKPLDIAISEGAMALFGEKYGETVRTITIGGDHPFSYELCGGTHVTETGDIGICLITSEGSVAAGVRRIEAVTGRKAYELVRTRFAKSVQAASLLGSTPDSLPEKVASLLDELSASQKQIATLKQGQAAIEFGQKLLQTKAINGIQVLSVKLSEADSETLRQMVDRFRQQFPTRGVVVLASARDGRPTIVAGITQDLVAKGLNAIELIKLVAAPLGGGGGGKPTLAQAGGKDSSRLDEALQKVEAWVQERVKVD
jgi:alanyl-tRNA synthetase